MSDNGERQPRCWPVPLVVALVALIAVVLTLDSSGAVPQLGEGPGLTLDETFNVQMGVYHVRALADYQLAIVHPESVKEVFGNPIYNPDHPPLGRLLIGLAHEISFPILKPDIPADAICVTCGRFASAGVFALTIFLVSWVTSRWFGRVAGSFAAISMLLMPRLFAHAHVASLETFVNLTYAATILWVATRWNGPRPPRWKDVVIGGILLGLCLLTKIQAVLLPIPIGVWMLWRWRVRGILPMIVFGLTGLVVFFVGWPWLWLDPIAHLGEYLGRATDRQTLYCWYLSHKWPDADVPWHYAAVMFLVTVPLGLHLLGLMGAISRRSKNGADAPPSPLTCILINVVWPLMFFALPGITVYDGTRLFLMVFPLWAIVIGRGGAVVLQNLQSRWGKTPGVIAVGVLLVAQCYGVIAMHPVQLSYYNLAVGGLRGASRLGFEVTYWGDSVTRSFQSDIRQSADPPLIDVAPVVHPFQLQEWAAQSPALREENLLRAFNGLERARPFVIVFRRRADSWSELTRPPAGSRLMKEVRREGVQLSALYALPTADP